MRFRASVAIAGWLWFSLSATVAQAQYEPLLKHIPDSANSIVLVNADSIFASPIAQSGGWAASREERFSAGMTSLPPKADLLVIAAEYDLGSMARLWEAAVVKSDSPPLLATVAREMGGVLDRVNETPSVRLADGSFIVEFSEGIRGALAPANRQQVARWIGDSGGHLPKYLESAVGYAERQANIIIALDLTDAITPDEVAHRMGENMDIYQDVLKQSPMEPQQLAELLASIQGVTLGITFRDQAYGSVKVDFGKDATPLAPIAKPLLLAVLAHRGAMIDEFSDWKDSVRGNSVILAGALTSSGLMRLSSLIELPTHGMHVQAKPEAVASTTPSEPSPDEQSPAQPPSMAQATQDYFNSTQRLLKNLRGHRGEAHSIGTIGMWFNNYAKYIDRLPMLNVDKEMLDYGNYLATQLRNCSLAIKGATIQMRPAAMAASSAAGGGSFGASAGGGYGYGYGSFYATGSSADYIMARAAGNTPGMAAFNTAKMEVRQQEAARVQVRSNLRAGAATSVQGILAEIEAATAKVRRDMTEKYQVNF